MDGVSSGDREEIVRAMRRVAREGLVAARHLRGEIYEVRVGGADVIYRLLFATDGAKSQVLLSLHAFVKKTQRTPPDAIVLAEKRLKSWRSRRRV
jgi:phage-related protein